MTPDISEAISRRFHGLQRPDDARILSEWICVDPANAKQFAIESIIHHRLRESLRSNAALRSLGAAPLRTSPARRRRLITAIAACLALGISLVLVLISASHRAPARLVAEIQTDWQQPGLTDLSGRCELRHGSARLVFRNGAEVLVEGPAEFTIAEKSIDLKSGRVLVRCPSIESREIVVRAAGREVIDLGTEFGVNVDSAGTATVGVLEGKVRCSDPGNGRAIELHAGQFAALNTLRVDARANLSGWANLARFDVRLAASENGNAAELAKRKLASLNDPTLIFATGRRGEMPIDLRTTRPLLSETPQTFNSNGRPNSMEFKTSANRLQGELKQTFDTITFSARVRLNAESADAPRHRGVVMSDGWGKAGQLHWQVKGRDFRLSYFDRGDEVDPRFAAAPDALVDGNWHLLTTTVRRLPKMKVTHYLDGKPVYERTFDSSPPPLTLGTFSIGGWTSDGADLPDRTLNGSIDDLQIWDRVLSDADVRALYESSKP